MCWWCVCCFSKLCKQFITCDLIWILCRAFVIEEMEQDPHVKKLTCVSSKAGRVKNSICWGRGRGGGAGRYWNKTSQLIRASGGREQCPAQQSELCASPKVNLSIPFASISPSSHSAFTTRCSSPPLSARPCPSAKMQDTQGVFPV